MNNLREIRKRKELSQLKLGQLTGIQPSEISRVENGWLTPYPSWRTRLAEALGVSEDTLFPDGTET